MTSDEMDKQIIAVKKQGLTPYVERHKIAQVRQTFYLDKIKSDRQKFVELIFRNINFLNRIHKCKISRYTVEDNMGLKTDDSFSDFVEGKTSMINFELVLLCASFFGIPAELLLFTDLEANEQTIRNEYPSLFKQSRH
jgi:hypothetical protein